MNKGLVGLAIAAALPLAAQDAARKEPARGSRHHFGVQAALWHNARASFTGSTASNPGPILADPIANATTIDRFYDNGFVRVDALGNRVILEGDINRTSFYRFESNDQVTAPNYSTTPITPGSVAYHSSELIGGDYARPFSNETSPSIELFYRYTALEKERWSLSLEAGLSWLQLDWDQSGTFGAVAGIIEDRYNTGAVNATATAVPYEGSPDPAARPGALIGSNPARQPYYTANATVATQREVGMDSIILRFGPSLDWKVCKRFDLSLLAGPAFGWSNTEFSFTDAVTVAHPAIPTYRQAGSADSEAFRVGLYSALRGAVRITDNWSALVEARHLWMEDIGVRGAGRKVNVSVSDGFGISLGIMKTF